MISQSRSTKNLIEHNQVFYTETQSEWKQVQAVWLISTRNPVITSGR